MCASPLLTYEHMGWVSHDNVALLIQLSHQLLPKA